VPLLWLGAVRVADQRNDWRESADRGIAPDTLVLVLLKYLADRMYIIWFRGARLRGDVRLLAV
jgi:hypothetical protein